MQIESIDPDHKVIFEGEHYVIQAAEIEVGAGKGGYVPHAISYMTFCMVRMSLRRTGIARQK